MRVAMIVPGGVDRSGEHRVIPCLLWLIERLARTNELHVFALRQERRRSTYPLLGATVHNVGARFAPARAVLSVLAEHRRRPFDILHAFWAVHPGVVAAIVGRLVRRPVVVHVTGGDLAAIRDIRYGLCARLYGPALLRFATRGAARVTVPSEFMCSKALARGIAAERIPVGVATDKWPPREPRQREAGEQARLLHVADLNPVKDQITLLRAMACLRRAGVDFHLDVVGVDTLGGRIQRLAEEYGLTGCVTFHGFLPHSQLQPLVGRAHVLVVSSRHEADPIVVMEAAMTGVPTVGTAVGHLVDWAPSAAVAVPVRDHGALAREIRALLSDEPRRLRIASCAATRVAQEDADWTAQRILRLYESLAS
jgi:glycosyltransferase involved in cell wall biosynthesis